MLPGFRGHLVSESFIESRMPELFPPSLAAGEARARQELVKWRSTAEALGPTSSVRARVDAGASRLLHALGFTAPSDLVHLESGMSGVIRAPRGSIVLLTTPWGQGLDS